jgi:YbbR domain-containing protein
MGRWLWENVGTLALALLLALVVWVIAVSEENPIEERVFSEPVGVDLLNLPPDLIRVGNVLTTTSVTIRAPRSTWETLTADQIHVTADLGGLTPATHEVMLQGSLDAPAARIIRLNPASIRLTLESRTTREFRIRVEPQGEPALGYEAGLTLLSASTATVTGPASAVDRVSEIVATISLADLKSDYTNEVTLVPRDTSGRAVAGVTLDPPSTRVLVPITQKTGFRDVAVKVVTQGQVAAGYRITNITVAPPVITVSSSDPQRVSDLPGFVETQPLDITDASDDISQRLALNLPEGVSPVGEQTVLVQVNIAAIEDSLTISRQLQIQGLGRGLSATASPEAVDVLLLGPLPELVQLRPEDVRVVLNLTGLEPGIHQVTPQVILLSDKLRAENVLPEQIEVTISLGVTPSRTPTPTVTPTPTATPRPTLRPTFTPSATPTPEEEATSTPAPG